MDMENIIKLIKTVSESSLTSFNFEEGNVKLSMEANKGVTFAEVPMNTVSYPISGATVTVADHKEEDVAKEGNIVTSPLVGIFYTASTEGAEPFITVGCTVKKGQTIGIVEAMKLMNEVESEYDGVVEEILVSNEQMVEFGQPLIRVK